jgi:hypothetical protein
MHMSQNVKNEIFSFLIEYLDFLSSTYKTMDKVQNKPNSSVQQKTIMIMVYTFMRKGNRQGTNSI